MKSLAAVKGIGADELTPDQIAAVNAELESEGFELEAYAKGETRFTQAQVDEAKATATADAEKATSDKIATLEADAKKNATALEEKDAEIKRLEGLAHGDNAPIKTGDNVHNDTSESKTPALDALNAERQKRIARRK